MIVKFLAVLLIAGSAYLAWWAISFDEWLWLVPSLAAVICGVRLHLHRRWGAYLWHFIALITAGWWIQSIVRIYLAGWPNASPLNTAISLMPGMFMLAVCVGGSAAVAKQFRSDTNAL